MISPLPRCVNGFDAARNLGFLIVTLRNWRNRGDGPPNTRQSSGRAIRYSIKDLHDWVETSFIGPRTERAG